MRLFVVVVGSIQIVLHSIAFIIMLLWLIPDELMRTRVGGCVMIELLVIYVSRMGKWT